jgi:iron-sulfur cluster assembly protein
MVLLKIKRKGEPKKVSIGLLEELETVSKDQLGISNAAASRILELTKDPCATDHYLRVAIRGGGCSGLSIHYEVALKPQSNDVVFAKDMAKVIIDKKSLSLLGGATLHCRDYLGSKEFFLANNPAEKQCSCGQSFAL